jgi:putative ABC transport system permease protein
MTPWHRLRGLVATLTRRGRQERDLHDELTAYVDDRVAGLVARGVDPVEARRQVLAEEGGIEPVKERARDARVGWGLATTLRDLRFGLRLLRRAPAFALVACLTLALGVGATIAMFTVMRSVLWRPLPYPGAERLVVLEVDARGVANEGATMGEVADLRARSRTLERLAMANGVDAHVEAGGEVERVGAASVSDDLLPALGAVPALGRLLDSRLDAGTSSAPAARGVVISDALWRRRFGADPHVVGRSVSINNSPRAIVGVLAPDFRVFLPDSVGTLEHTDVWFSTEIGTSRTGRSAGVVGQLRPGMTLADAQQEVAIIAAQLAAEHPSIYQGAGVQFRLRGVRTALTQRVDAGLQMLAIAVGCVLVLSGVNLATLLVARGAARTREIDVRRALGAGRARLIRQLLSESLVITAIGSAVGLVLARLMLNTIDWLRPTHLPRQSQIAMDWTVAVFAIGIAIAAGLVFGALPAWRLTRGDSASLTRGRGDTVGRSTRRLQRALVVAEIALSIVPLVAAGLMLRSFQQLTQAPLGFEPDRVLTAWMPISFRQFKDFEARWQVHRDAIAKIAALPGVEAVSAVSPVPFGPLQFTRRYGRAGDAAPAAVANMQSVLPGYFKVAGTKLLQGRDLSDDDLATKRPVAVVDERIARTLWPDGAIGRRLALGSDSTVLELEVVGVTEAVRTRDARDAMMPHLYVPYHVWSVEMALAIRTSQPADALQPSIARIVAGLGTGRAVEVRPLAGFVRDAVAETRFVTIVLTGFAIAATLLAAVGLYGTLAYITAQRLREFGIRIALGSTRGAVLRLVAGLRLTLIGAATGAVAALAVAFVIRRMLYGVGPVDPLTLAAVAGVVLAIGVAACLRPAWTAARADPLIALKSE